MKWILYSTLGYIFIYSTFIYNQIELDLVDIILICIGGFLIGLSAQEHTYETLEKNDKL